MFFEVETGLLQKRSLSRKGRVIEKNNSSANTGIQEDGVVVHCGLNSMQR